MPTNPNWTDWEDQELRRLVEEHGPKKWSLIASKLKSKGSKQCRRRWKNYLNADLKQGGWSAEEDKILLDGHKKYGNKWTEIAKLVGGRTDNAVKNRWAALCKRNQRTARGPTTTTAARGRKRNVDAIDSDEDSLSSPGSSTPPRLSPRFNTRARTSVFTVHNPAHQQLHHHQVLQNGLYASTAAVSLAASVVAAGLGKRSASGGGMEQLAKRQQVALGRAGPALDLRSPRGKPDALGRFGSGLSSPGGRDGSPNGTSSHRSRASGSSHLTSVSPPGRKGKPELTLLIPNAAADPPAPPPPPGGLEIHVMKDLLSPAEVRYARELNEMEIPLQIALEDPLEPPLSTSRRAAQDALTALVAGSPTGTGMGLGPMSLYGMGDYGPSGPASATSDLNELLKWFQHNFTPRSARQAVQGGQATSRGIWASPVAGNGSSAVSPRLMTRSAARLATPRGTDGMASGWESGSGGGTGERRTPRSGGSTGTQNGNVDAACMHDGHRQLLSKLLNQAKTGIEDLHAHVANGIAQQAPQEQPKSQSTPSRMSPRLHARMPQPWNMPTNPPVQQQHAMLTGAQAAAAIASLPMPNMPNSTNGKKTRHGNAITGGPAAGAASGARAHPGPTGGLALSSLGGLLSPAPGNGPLSSGRGNGWAGLDVVLTPAISQQDLNALLELLTADE